MILEITHVLIAIGYNRNVCNLTSGENMPDFRETDLKLRHGTMFKRALKS